MYARRIYWNIAGRWTYLHYLEHFDKLTINIVSYYEILRDLKDLANDEKIRMFEDFIQENELLKVGILNEL